MSIFLGLALLIAGLLFFIPVKFVPGNDLRVQLALFGPIDYVLLAVIGALESLLLMMWGHLVSQKRPNRSWGSGALGVVSGLPTFLFGAKLCPMCMAGVLGFLGPPALWFALEHRLWLFVLSAVLLLVSIYAISRRIHGVCEDCLRGNQTDHSGGLR